MCDAFGHEHEAEGVNAQAVLEVVSPHSAVLELESGPLAPLLLHVHKLVLLRDDEMSRRFFVVKDPERPLVDDLALELLECPAGEPREPFELEVVFPLCVEKL